VPIFLACRELHVKSCKTVTDSRKLFYPPQRRTTARAPLLGLWIAAPAVGAAAYLSCYPSSALSLSGAGSGGGGADFIFTNLYWISVALIFVRLFHQPYFGRMKFDMSYWAAGFPSAALALVSMQYHMLKPGGLSAAIAYAFLAVCSYLNTTLLLHTLAGIRRRRIFTPNYKWGPLSFMRLTHEAFRGALPHLEAAAQVRERKEEEGVPPLASLASFFPLPAVCICGFPDKILPTLCNLHVWLLCYKVHPTPSLFIT
jgi:hypothetical protein